jgi:cell division septation protein DedD
MPKPNQSAVCMPHTTQEPVQRQAAPIPPKPETQPADNEAQPAPTQPEQEVPQAATAYTATLHTEAAHSAPQAVPVQKTSVHSEAVTMPVRKASQAAPIQFEPVHAAPTHTAPTQAPSVQASPAPEASPQFEDSVREMLVAIEADMRLIRQALAAGDMASTGRHAGFIAHSADRHGLRVLARMARCVESAAKALDDDALHNLLPELEAAVERNRIALTQAK